MKIKILDEVGLPYAIHAMRNPMDSWEKSDTQGNCLGEADKALMLKLIKAGAEHRTFLRFIQLYVDIEAPLYWWKEMDRYTVGKAQVSCSTMHTLGKRELTIHDFECGNISADFMAEYLVTLNALIRDWQENKVEATWKAIIQLLLSSFIQKRTVIMSAEVALKILNERSNHKLIEWRQFCHYLHRDSFIISVVKEAYHEDKR